MMLGATVSKAVAALLRWLGLALGVVRPSWEAAEKAFLRLWRRLLRRASPGDTSPWSELPPELLGLVLSRLPSQADRVRLRAVCRPWRSAPRPQPLPAPFPWIILRDDTFLTVPDGAPHRLPRHLCCGGSHRLPSHLCCTKIVTRVSAGSTLFLGHSTGRCCLVNPCSGETTPLKISLASYRSCWIRKVVLSDHIVAFLIKGEPGNITIIPREPRPGARHMKCVPSVNIFDSIIDIALFQGKLYVLTRKSNDGAGPQQVELHLLDINHEQNRVGSVQCISATPIHFVAPCSSDIRTQFYFYLVASGDRLLMVERQIDIDVSSFPIGPYRPTQTWFKVSEAVDLIGGHGRWSKVDRLFGRALFVGRECSESLPAQCGAREDCIYFMTERPNFLPRQGREPEDDLLDCVVYNVRDRTVEPLTWEKGVTRNGPWHPTWLFPADV